MSLYGLFFGSLRQHSKRGYNFNRFGPGTQRYLRDHMLTAHDLHDLGSYPAICPGTGTVKCELHEVEPRAMEAISRMEKGAGYQEVKTQVALDPGDPSKTVEAVYYVWPRERLERGGYPKVESGDWA